MKLKEKKENRIATFFRSGSERGAISHADAVTTAESIWCTSVAVCHLPIVAADKIVPSFKAMFPDSKIAASMECRRNKTARILSDGLGPHFKREIENEIRNEALGYTIEIDETTTSKHWRQLDILVRYFSDKHEKVVVFHLLSITLGRAQASVIFDKIRDAVTPLYTRKLLQISSDGPNVMKALHKKVRDELNPNLIDISTCNIHKIHNAFSKAYDSFGSDVEDLGIEIYYYFKTSPVRMEDFEQVQCQLGIPQHVFLRHLPTRWLTLEHVTDRLIEQLPALQKFFTQSTSGNEQRKNNRCRCIQDILNLNKFLLVEMLFLKSVMGIFAKILRLLQTEAPLIHILHDEMSKLTKTLLLRFVKSEFVEDKYGAKLYDIDIENEEIYMKRCDIGTAAKVLLDSLVSDEKVTRKERALFFERTKTFFRDVVKELLRTLPLKNRLLQDLQFLHPISRKSANSVECVRRTAVTLALFPRNKIDDVVDEWKVFQCDDIPLESLEQSREDPDEYPASEIDEETEDTWMTHRIDKFWQGVFKMRHTNGSLK